MGKTTGGHLAAKYMKQVEKVSTVFTLSGGHIENLLDGLAKNGIRTVDVRHEQVAAMMAHAWSVYKKETGVCLVTAGPGFTNALTGIANAHLDNAPLVVLCGRHPLRDDLTGALQEMNQIDMVKPITKWAATCYEAKRIPEYLSIAFRQATQGRPGPVFLELPPDILFGEVDEDAAPFPEKKTHKTHTVPAPSELEAAAKLIDAAKRPLIIGGNGIGNSDCKEELTAFIEKSGAPFALVNSGKGVVPDDHELSLSEGGFTGLLAGAPQADLIIALGIRFNWIMMSGKLFPDAKVVRVDIDPTEVDRNRASDVGLVGDCAQVLAQLTPKVKKRTHKTWLNNLKKATEAFIFTELEQRKTVSDPIHPNRLVAKIMEKVGLDAYYVADGGDTSYYALAGFRSIHPAGVM
ncbi:MAG: thiamine pyrophosphate-binding protein, partial [Proteobacteria bacterium]|nr:thiamine pyrophosphate-binding protein [Pseudomonadota bacterium]